MPIKTLVVVLPTIESVAQVMPFAIQIAEDHDAHLVGVHAEASAITCTGVGMGFAVQEFAALRAAEERQTAEIETAFAAAVAGTAQPTEWRVGEMRGAPSVESLLEHAHYADLIITPQETPYKGQTPGNQMQEQLVWESGRPVLMVPHAGEFKSVGKHALVGLSPTRQSSRAAFDALDLIGPGAKAIILTAHRLSDHDRLPFDTAKELARSYTRHGIEVTVQDRPDPTLSPGDILLNEAFERGCDLIVAGAYGHRRIYDIMVGETTTQLMAHMTAPVLFSA